MIAQTLTTDEAIAFINEINDEVDAAEMLRKLAEMEPGEYIQLPKNHLTYDRETGTYALYVGSRPANQVPGLFLIQARGALWLELQNTAGMVASARVNARTVIPHLKAFGITGVEGRLTRAKKVQAYNDLNTYMAEHGFESKPL